MRTLLIPLTILTLHSQETTPISIGKRILAADDSTHRLAIINPDGKIEREEKIGPIHDAQLLPNGNLLFQTNWTNIIEKTPQGKIIWQYDAAAAHPGKRVEIHAFQRFTDGTTMVAESGPARIIELDSKSQITHTITLKIQNPNPHSDTRLVRRVEHGKAKGNYLVAHESDGTVREYQRDGTIAWEYTIPLFDKSPAPGHGPEGYGNAVFSAIRLENGNTLIGTGNGHSVLEVTPQKTIAWQVHQKDIPGITLAWVCRVERLKNGNTLINNCHAGNDQPQLIEINPEKKLIWSWKDHKNFGNSTPVAFLLE